MLSSMLSYRNGTWRRIVLVVLSGAFILPVMAPVGGRAAVAADAKPAQPAATTTTPTTAPKLPAVPSSITDGQSVAALLSQAVGLDAVGVDTSGVRSAISGTQQQLDQDAVTVRQLRQAAALAQQRATVLAAEANRADQAYASLDHAVKQAVLFLYVNGPSSLTVNPDAGNALAYAIDYADTAITPNGVLAKRGYDAGRAAKALAAAKRAEAAADRATAAATAEVAKEKAGEERLLAELGAMVGATAVEVAADHTALASQAGTELLSTTSLQFTPKGSIPAPLSTTTVALKWAFAELGKPYLWGGTGPNAFDCSGLTQFVWQQAGVSIPRVAAAQYAWTIPVPLSQLLPGDLVFYGTTDIHHVGIYIGQGLMINAPHTGTVIQVSSIWWSDLAGFGRVHAPGAPVPLHQPPSLTQPVAPAVIATPGPVPSQAKAPPGWKPTPGSSTPLRAYPGPPPTTAPTTVAPPTTSTSVLPTTTTTPASSTTTSTLSTSTTTSTTSTTTPPGGNQSS